jgi:ParB-like chromosome segregation protein Spo0J
MAGRPTAAPALDMVRGLRYAQNMSMYADRIVQVGVEELRPWPGNPRRGDLGKIRESIAAHGVYKPLLIQESSGLIMAGNNVWFVAREMGIQNIGVLYLDVDDETARKIVLVDNRSSDSGGYDDGLLREMLEGLGDYAGTGYTREDVRALLSAAAEEESRYLESLLTEDGDEDVYVLEDVATGADWAELPQQEAARAERQAGQVVAGARGVREIMLVYTREEHEEMIRLMDGLQKSLGIKRYPQIVQRLVREAARDAGMR